MIFCPPADRVPSSGGEGQIAPEIEADAPGGFDDADVGVGRNNTKQLKFTPGWTGFEG